MKIYAHGFGPEHFPHKLGGRINEGCNSNGK